MSGYGELAVKPAKLPNHATPPVCTLTLCDGFSSKCSRVASLKAGGFNQVSKVFKTSKFQTTVELQVKVECPLVTAGHINTVYLDLIKFVPE